MSRDKTRGAAKKHVQLSSADFRKALREGLKGGWLFCGDEEYMKRFCLGEARKAVVSDDMMRVSLDFDSYTPERLAAELTSVPFLGMEGLRLVELYGLNYDKFTAEEWDSLTDVLGLDYSETAVLIVYTIPEELTVSEGYNRPGKAFTVLSEYLMPVVFEQESPSALTKWIARRFDADKLKVTTDAAAMLLDCVGNDMTRLSCEVEKVAAYALSHGLNAVTVNEVKQVVSITTELGSFDFTNALLERDRAKALLLLKEMLDRRTAPELISGMALKQFTDMTAAQELAASGLSSSDIASSLKLNEFVVKKYLKQPSLAKRGRLNTVLKVCAETDSALKGSSQDPEILLTRLIIELTF
ncbi:MAG: DNA polymerase III subunit delta [Clostridiales bacterium]|nr:DNA polymerase III subunit delta [Clostridiales bacterium]